MVDMLGCHLAASVIERSGTKHIVGPIFSVDKLNTMGWRLDATEAETMANSLVGKPVRYCTSGKDVIAVNGQKVAKEHACDVLAAGGPTKADIGEVSSVYKKVNKDGMVVWYAEAKVGDSISVDSLPTGWSVFGGAESRDDLGYVHGSSGSAISLTDSPAYTEARTAIIAASTVDTNSNINTTSEYNTKQSNMTDTTTVNQAGSTTTVQTAPLTHTVQDAVTKSELADTIKKVREEVKAPTVDEAKIVERVRNELMREDAAKSIVAKMIRAGALTDAEKDAKFSELKALDMNSLNTLKSAIDAVPIAKPKPEAGVSDAQFVGTSAGTGGPRILDEGERVWISRLGLDEKTWLKYNPNINKNK